MDIDLRQLDTERAEEARVGATAHPLDELLPVERLLVEVAALVALVEHREETLTPLGRPTRRGDGSPSC